MKASIIVFPGSNCDRDVKVALEQAKIKTTMTWHNDATLPKTDLVVLPGGFSYGDYLRCGSIASKSRIMKEVIKHSKQGRLVMGICNGFQILVESELLPGVLIRNINLKFICKTINVKILNNKTFFTKETIKNNVLKLPIAHNEGNYFASKDLINKLEDNEQIVIKYCDENGNINLESNPNGSLNNIAGIVNKSKNVFGLMPHPERASDIMLEGTDGSLIFNSLTNYARS
jgi:phosphoribosylformylglycinamidine synthase subunit PurQ / glutaminase